MELIITKHHSETKAKLQHIYYHLFINTKKNHIQQKNPAIFPTHIPTPLGHLDPSQKQNANPSTRTHPVWHPCLCGNGREPRALPLPPPHRPAASPVRKLVDNRRSQAPRASSALAPVRLARPVFK